MAYSKVERHMWSDERFRRFRRDVRDMWQYLLTNEHSNRLGMFVLDPLYAAADLSCPDDRWSEERVLSAWRDLEDAGRIKVDLDARLVIIVNHLKHNAPENPNVVKGAIEELNSLPFSETVWTAFLEACRRFVRPRTEKGGEPFGELWTELVSQRIEGERNPSTNPSVNGSGNGSVNGMGNPEPEPEPEPIPTKSNGSKDPTAAPPKVETETDPYKELHRLRSAAVPLIQTHLWLGDKPPKPGWHKGRDLSIWNEMLKQFSPHEINGAITVCRTVVHEEIGMRPITMEYFNAEGKRDRMSRCVAAWRQSETRKLAAERRGLRLIGDDIEEVVRAAAG